MSPETWYQDAATFSWKGQDIIYKQSKSDKPWLVLIHGFPSCSFDWWKIWDQLSEQYNLIAPDMIGFGRSAKPIDFDYSIRAQADIHLDLIDKLGINKFHILAHDYGDTVTQEIMARELDGADWKTLSVCLLNGGIFPEVHKPLLIQKLLMSPIGFLLSKMMNEKKLDKSFSRIFGPNTQLTKEELHEYWELLAYNNGHRLAHKLIWYMQERADNRERWVGALQQYKGKIGIINGPVDPISGGHMVDHYKELVSTENIWLLENIGHYPQVEDAEGVLKAYEEFVAV
ncbi:MAG: alpha/beta hydrolase [Cytophagales bacterium]|nr:alpha/beta hydrolase [Cytophagales bacterium]